MVGVPAFLKCVCGPSARIGWPLPCRSAQRIDDRGPKDEDDQRRGDQRAAGAEGDVAEDVEGRDLVGKRDEKGEHSCPSPQDDSRSFSKRPEFFQHRLDQLREADTI
jgi:hypothetical protein